MSQETKVDEGRDAASAAPRSESLFKSWWFWVGLVVLLAGFALYVRTWKQSVRLDFSPATNPPPPIAEPAKP